MKKGLVEKYAFRNYSLKCHANSAISLERFSLSMTG